MLKERMKTYIQHIRQPELQQIGVKRQMVKNSKCSLFLQFRKVMEPCEVQMKPIL